MGPNDSLWIRFDSNYGVLTKEAYGCADTTYTVFGYSSVTQLHEEDQITFDVTSKKNGVVETFSETHDLLPAELVPITINY